MGGPNQNNSDKRILLRGEYGWTTKIKDNQNVRPPKCKTTKMEDDQNGRRPKWKTTKMDK